MSQAIVHGIIASEYARNTSTITNAGQHLILAASVMDFLANKLLPKWTDKPNNLKVTRPPEVQESICLGLINFSMFP